MATYTQDVVVLDAGLLKVPAAADTISLAKVAFTATANFTGCVVTGLAGGVSITDGTGTFGYLGAAGALSITGTTTMDLDCSGAFQINSSGAAISLANDAVNQPVSIATGGTRVLTIGTTTTTWTAVAAGMTLDATTLSIDSVDTTNLTMTAHDAGTKTMTISATNAGAGVASMVLSSDGPWTADAAGVLELNSSAGVISIGNDAVNQDIGIAMGGTRTLRLGTVTTTWAAVAAGMTLDATTLSIDSVDTTNLTMTANDGGTKVLTIAASNAGAGVAQLMATADGPMDLDAVGILSLNSSGAAINVGNDANSFAINVGTAGTRTVTVGSATATLVLNSTAGALAMTIPDNTANALTITGAGDPPLLTVTTTNGFETVGFDANVSIGKSNGGGAFCVEGTAGEPLAVGDVITVSGTAGKYFQSDANSATAVRQYVSGVAMIVSTADGQLARVAVHGIAAVTFDGAVATSDIGKIAYLSTTVARATLTAPTALATVYKIGIVTGASGGTSAQVNIQPQYISTLV